MLQELAIRNFAIIEDVRITLESGLTVLSGETGAGKSIILNAVNLLLGARVSDTLIRTGADSAELEALFQVDSDSHAGRAMQAQDLDPSEGLVIRRVISKTNRHRVYLNGRLSTMQALTEIAGKLASIAGQHAQQMLLDEAQHLAILDQYADLTALRQEVAELYQASRPLIRQLEGLKARRQTQSADLDLLRGQIEEIEQTAPAPDEDRALERELRRLRNGRQLLQTLQGGRDRLYSRSGAVVEHLQGVEKELQAAARFDSALNAMAEILADCRYRIEELAVQMGSHAAAINLDAQQLETVEARLDQIQKLKRRYGGSLTEVLSHLERIRSDYSQLESLAGTIATEEKHLAAIKESLFDKAASLSERRRHSAEVFARAVEAELESLSMGSTRMEVELQPHAPRDSASSYHVSADRMVTASGFDRCRFMIAPNIGEALRPLKAIASGGELSRIILAIKAILASTDTVQTLIFDEVDAGIGGSVGEAVGSKLAQLARHHQIVCITHLPQIAVYGQRQFKISKRVQKGRTRTLITPVEAEKRVEEIARMLGGITITAKTRAHAQEMLSGTLRLSDGSDS